MNNFDAASPTSPQRESSERFSSARPALSSLERTSGVTSGVAGVIERRRAAQSALDELLMGLSPAESAMPRRVTGEVGFILHARDWS